MQLMLTIEKRLFQGLHNGPKITMTPLEGTGLVDCQTLATGVCIGQSSL